jgi:triosephosphate isomerase
MSKKIVIGNWKMHPSSLKEAESLFSGVSKSLSKIKKTEVVICPPFVYLEKLKKLSKKINLGAQDSFFGEVGAFTGEISGEMLDNIGVKYVILGHSERRALGEDNVLINKKIKSVLSLGLKPILCVGESSRDESHEYFNIVKMQIVECLRGINKNFFPKIIIAYEPVWALSTTVNRKDATSLDAREMSIYIRKVLSDLSNPEIANKTRVIYGGSVNDRDAEDFLRNGGVDGVLPGKASLSVEKFTKIIQIAENL